MAFDRLSRQVAAVVSGVAILAATGVFLSEKADTKIELCSDPEKTKCEILTREEYTALKTGIAEKMTADMPLTWEEFQLLIGILNRELWGKKNLGAVNEHEPLKQKLTNLLYAR